MANERPVVTTVEGIVLNTNVEPANNGKVYPRVTLQTNGRYNEVVECVTGLVDQIKKLKAGQRILMALYTKVGQVEVQKRDGGTFRKMVTYLDNAYDIRVLG